MTKINNEKCIGCGVCISIAPINFEMSEDYKAILISDKNKSKIQEAIECCPVGAIE